MLSIPLDPVPNSIARTADGWLDADDLSQHVRTSLSQTVGGVFRPGEGSFDLQRWTDVDTANRRVQLAAALWVTGFVATPQGPLGCIAGLGESTAAFAERALSVRVTWERRAGVSRPGKVTLEIQVTCRDAPGHAPLLVLPPPHLRCLAGDFLDHLTS